MLKVVKLEMKISFSPVRATSCLWFVSFPIAFSILCCMTSPTVRRAPHVKVFVVNVFECLRIKKMLCFYSLDMNFWNHVSILSNKNSLSVSRLYHFFHYFADTIQKDLHKKMIGKSIREGWQRMRIASKPFIQR